MTICLYIPKECTELIRMVIKMTLLEIDTVLSNRINKVYTDRMVYYEESINNI